MTNWCTSVRSNSGIAVLLRRFFSSDLKIYLSLCISTFMLCLSYMLLQYFLGDFSYLKIYTWTVIWRLFYSDTSHLAKIDIFYFLWGHPKTSSCVFINVNWSIDVAMTKAIQLQQHFCESLSDLNFYLMPSHILSTINRKNEIKILCNQIKTVM